MPNRKLMMQYEEELKKWISNAGDDAIRHEDVLMWAIHVNVDGEDVYPPSVLIHGTREEADALGLLMFKSDYTVIPAVVTVKARNNSDEPSPYTEERQISVKGAYAHGTFLGVPIKEDRSIPAGHFKLDGKLYLINEPTVGGIAEQVAKIMDDLTTAKKIMQEGDRPIRLTPVVGGPDDFPGTDEGSHYMNTKQGLEPLRNESIYIEAVSNDSFWCGECQKLQKSCPLTPVCNRSKASVAKPHNDLHSVGNLYILKALKDQANRSGVGDVWELISVHSGDNSTVWDMCTLENTTTNKQITIRLTYLTETYYMLGRMDLFKVGDGFHRSSQAGAIYEIVQIMKETAEIVLRMKNGTLDATLRIDKLTAPNWTRVRS